MMPQGVPYDHPNLAWRDPRSQKRRVRALTRTLTTISSRQISGAAGRSMPSSMKFEPTVAEATTKMRRIAPDVYKT